MDHLEKVEQVMQNTGCSFEDAKSALERSDWDILESALLLEREGKAAQSSSSYSTGSESEETADSAESTDSDSNSSCSSFSDGTRSASSSRQNFWDSLKGFFRKVGQVLSQNFVILYSKAGNQLFHIPIWVALIPFLLWFWGVLIICLVLMVFGCRFQFEGRDFGTARINGAVERAGNAAYEAGQRVKREFSGKDDEN